MNLENIQKRPIIIFSTPRSGSTVLAMNIIKHVSDSSLKLFNEVIDYNLVNRSLNNFTEFEQFSEINKNYVLKTHLWDFIKYFPVKFKKQIDEHREDFYLIRIRRKDVAAQLLSYYIAVQRKMWAYTATDKTYSNVVFSHYEMKSFLPIIKLYNKILNESTYTYDMDLYYEDLIFDKDVGSIQTPKPENYKLLYNFANKLVSSKENLEISISEKELWLKHFPNQEIKL